MSYSNKFRTSLFITICALVVWLWARQYRQASFTPVAPAAARRAAPIAMYIPEQEQVTHTPFMKKDMIDACSSLWLPDRLVGRCFGLKDYFTYVEYKNVGAVNSTAECRSMCCDLKSCVSWQYWAGSHVCKLGGPARLGGEGGESANWCEPQPPLRWTGQLKDTSAATLKDGTCAWAKDLPTQCFGLGVERRINNTRMTATQCQMSCCKDAKCMMYQHADSKGCFHDSGGNGKNFCETYMGSFDGGRKCRPQDGCPTEGIPRPPSLRALFTASGKRTV